MNNRFLTLASIVVSSSLLLAGCDSDTSSFETPNPEIESNPGTVSQKNMSIGADEPNPSVYDATAGTLTETSVLISVKVGDINNQLITDGHTIYFATEWGLIEPSCTTVDGECSVTWQTSSWDNIPLDFFTTVTAWTTGEETYIDTNANNLFDEADTTFEDREEPFVDANGDGVYSGPNELLNIVNGNDLTGINGVHDIGDGFLNSPNCTHPSLCSTVLPIGPIWVDMQLDMLVNAPTL